ncbi:hypothetical protein F2P56_036343 [Juglans regia]|uniref:Reverse transcriptase Ty1/copia-type domain-containing protein n=1 Tax=Juglans regia TaxID=51240 RepID=A0A833TLV4_JUGRE|nr:hypothetical protein F2P56_036343 [Juglans regia]
MDVKNAFLHGDLKEEIYMSPPPGMFTTPSSETSAGIVLLLVYVDDIVIIGSDTELIKQLQQHLNASFHMKDLGPLQYFLGLEVQIIPTGTLLYQHKYTQELISLASLQSGNFVLTSLEVNLKFRQEEGELLSDSSLYRQLVGSLNYLTITHPDISFAVQHVSQFMRAPRHLHLAAVRRNIRYLKGTSTRGLFFSKESSLQLVGV